MGNQHPGSNGDTESEGIFMQKAVCLLLVLFGVSLEAQSRFVHADGKFLVDGAGHKLILRGTNLGNWLVPEGYMFHFKNGPQSPREIEALVNELIGPDE